ncbi:FecR protein [Novipirellula aureliae]|uniref:FecR protein n=1 Tax=Novipirellula aureliae TaxID=2527966 RepID=A0A5C6E5Y7_9BACT|nr:LamG-like jellyroll fold domain-containing protein [Novipirellula aureliae]TWU44238.1 FecR protein [Novipirellula aureliae]
MSKNRFDELLHLLLDDDITAAQMDELTEIVSDDRELLTRLRQHLSMSDRLSQYEDPLRNADRFMDALKVRLNANEDTGRFFEQVMASARDEACGQLRQASGQWKQASGQLRQASASNEKSGWQVARGLAGWMTAAVALVILASVIFQNDRQRGKDDLAITRINRGEEETSDAGVAVLTRVSGLQGAQTVDWAVGETIPPGLLEWSAGLLQLEFYCGATVVAEGPASLEILDDSRVICRSGRLRVHVPEPARGFAVLAPTVELVDLGTEFGVDVAVDGSTEVHVFDGSVELYDAMSDRNVTTRRELTAGDAVSLDHGGESRKIDTREFDFVTPNRLSTMAHLRRQEHLLEWRMFRDSLLHDPRVVAYFPFDRNVSDDRLLIGYGSNGTMLEGAIVGCEWSEGRWPSKTSLQFKRPGDRVRVTLPGEFESLTYSTWLRVDGLDRSFNSLLLTDGFDTNGPHWQIRGDGVLILGVKHPVKGKYGYKTDSIFNLFRLGQWVHLATVYDNSKSRVSHYVNGELASREALHEAASGLLTIGNATIGNWSLPVNSTLKNSERLRRQVRNFNGCMDELIVFGEALDDQEIRHIYEVGRP